MKRIEDWIVMSGCAALLAGCAAEPLAHQVEPPSKYT
jgi:hypothetical protein